MKLYPNTVSFLQESTVYKTIPISLHVFDNSNVPELPTSDTAIQVRNITTETDYTDRFYNNEALSSEASDSIIWTSPMYSLIAPVSDGVFKTYFKQLSTDTPSILRFSFRTKDASNNTIERVLNIPICADLKAPIDSIVLKLPTGNKNMSGFSTADLIDGVAISSIFQKQIARIEGKVTIITLTAPTFADNKWSGGEYQIDTFARNNLTVISSIKVTDTGTTRLL